MGSYNIREELEEALDVLRKFTADDSSIAAIEKPVIWKASAGKVMYSWAFPPAAIPKTSSPPWKPPKRRASKP